MRAICCNHHCPRFEFRVAVSDDVADAETERCSECGHLLVHESGLTFRDALGEVVRPGAVIRFRGPDDGRRRARDDPPRFPADVSAWASAAREALRGRGRVDASRRTLRGQAVTAQEDVLFEWLLEAANPRRGAGDFVRHLAEAALRADPENYPILRPALMQIVAKYPEYGNVPG